MVTVESGAPQGRRYGRRNLVNPADIIYYVHKAFGVELKSGTIRQWAARRKIGTYGHRRERYDLREVLNYARSQGIIPRRKQGEHGTGD